jgi:tRNA pseudouridine-54 N-methylase
MRRFVIHFIDFPINAEDVKAGRNAAQVLTAYRCVNVGLFLSGDMRRDVEVVILTGSIDDLSAIVFPGSKLKRVSPDERSITFFLLKAKNELDKLAKGEWRRLPNGITVQRASLNTLVKQWDTSEVYVAKKGTLYTEKTKSPGEGICIFESNEGYLLEGLSDVSIKPLFRPTHPEQFILEMNILHDRTKSCVEKSS